MFSAKTKIKIDINPLKLAGRMRRESERALFIAASILRKSMRRLITTTKKKNSLPGKPPKSHVGRSEFGLRSVVFKVDKPTLSMKVGPIIESNKDLPGKLEKGGLTAFKLVDGKVVRYRLAPRPFSSVALENFIGSYPELWRNVIK